MLQETFILLQHLFYFIANVRTCQNKINAAIKQRLTFILLQHILF